MKYKFSKFENNSIVKYEFNSYQDAKLWIDNALNKFKIINRVRDENTDRAFLSYKRELLQELENIHKADKGQVMDDYSQCVKCSIDDHEGNFCRCEERNIRIGKEKRARGESPWLKSQPERLNPEGATECACDSPISENK